jgi:hypothetical protein
VALKFSPLVSEEMLSSWTPFAEPMSIPTGLKLPIGDPSTVAPVKLTLVKSASGRIPPLSVQQGTSAMTSAEDRAAPDRVLVTVWLQSSVVSESLSVKLLPSV